MRLVHRATLLWLALLITLVAAPFAILLLPGLLMLGIYRLLAMLCSHTITQADEYSKALRTDVEKSETSA
jgi:hypothetical protein